MHVSSSSMLVKSYIDREYQWSAFIDKNIPKAHLLRWGPQHRVFRYGKKVFKVEMSSFGQRDSSKSLAYEYELLSSTGTLNADFSPEYSVIDEKWYVLEIDWINGDFLNDLIFDGNTNNIPIRKILYKLFLVSLSGIYYKQFRGRHIILGSENQIVFIDFGHAIRTNFASALWRNFAPLNRVNGQWVIGKVPSIMYEVFRNRGVLSKKCMSKEDTVDKANRRWKVNYSRVEEALPAYLDVMPGDAIAAENLTLMEKKMFEAIKLNPKVAEDAIEFKFSSYGMAAHRDWGFIWDYIRNIVDFHGKEVIDIGSGMGGVCAFARIEGASKVTAFEDDPLLLEASRFCSQALGFTDNIYNLSKWCSLISGETKLPHADIVFALSTRLEDVPKEPLIEIISGYPEVFWLSQSNDKDIDIEIFKNYGFSSVELIVRVDSKRSVLHAVK